MPLLPAHYAALKAHINANTNTIPYGDGPPVLINTLPLNGDAADEIAKWYNTIAVPNFWVWRTRLTKKELTEQTSRTGSTFTRAAAGFIQLTVGERAAWTDIWDDGEPINPSLPATRATFADIFSSGGNAALNRVHCDVMARRQATYAEMVLALGTGGDATATAGTMTFEGLLTGAEVEKVRNS